MALTFEQLKAAFQKRNAGNGGEGGGGGFWDKFYPFYKMGFDEVALFRFLPDLDEENPLGFVVENKYHELIINGKKKRVACLDMYGEACPCCERSQHYYNDVGDEKLGKAFWRKIDYIASGLVMQSPFEYPIKPDENPARLISMTPKLFKKIETAMLSGDFDKAPYDLIDGCDFRIMKTRQGEYADYSSSEFARKVTPVTDSLLERVKLMDLKTFRHPKMEREQMEALIEAFMTGRSYTDSNESTGNKELDQKLAEPKATPTVSAAAPAPQASAPAEATAPAAAPAASGSSRAQEILARLRRDKGQA